MRGERVQNLYPEVIKGIKEKEVIKKVNNAGEAPLSPPFKKVDEIYPDLIVTRFNPETPDERIVEGFCLEAEKTETTSPGRGAKKSKPSKTQEEIDLAGRVIEYLNQKAGRNFRTNTGDNAKGIIAQARQGYTEAQMCRVIDCKTRQWGSDPKMCEHLNPVTLFRHANFERYLIAAELPPMQAAGAGPKPHYNPNRSQINRAGGDLSKYDEPQIF